VRVSGRWLEAYGFKEGARFVAVGVEGGLLVLTVYEPAPEGGTSSRHARACAALVRLRGANHPDPCASLFTLHNAPCKRLRHNTTAAPAPALRARFLVRL